MIAWCSFSIRPNIVAIDIAAEDCVATEHQQDVNRIYVRHGLEKTKTIFFSELTVTTYILHMQILQDFFFQLATFLEPR